MNLPRFFGLSFSVNNETNDTYYMQYIKENVETQGLINFKGNEIVSPCAKYEFVEAKSGTELVHIRCCYNNKFLARCSQYAWWISASEDEQVEDKSKWSCTLFEPAVIMNQGNSQIQLRHVQTGTYAYMWNEAPFGQYDWVLSTNPAGQSRKDDFQFTDWESLVILPKHVSFKGHNGQYLGLRLDDGIPYLCFNIGDKQNDMVAHDIFTNPDGTVRIRYHKTAKFWRRSDKSWIWPDSEDFSKDEVRPEYFRDISFNPVIVDKNVIALRNMGNSSFCSQLTMDGMDNCLNANADTLTKEVQLEVEEIVISRSIYNVRFRPGDSRIYGQQKVTLGADQVVTNGSSDTTTAVLKFSESVTTTSTWDYSVSLKVGAVTKIETGIPFIAEGHIEISAEFEGSYKWGGSTETEQTLENSYTVHVPPMSKMKVSMVATKGMCDVPFSYTQRDTLMDGEQVILNQDDGLYTGVSYYNVTFENKEEKL